MERETGENVQRMRDEWILKRVLRVDAGGLPFKVEPFRSGNMSYWETEATCACAVSAVGSEWCKEIRLELVLLIICILAAAACLFIKGNVILH